MTFGFMEAYMNAGEHVAIGEKGDFLSKESTNTIYLPSLPFSPAQNNQIKLPISFVYKVSSIPKIEPQGI